MPLALRIAAARLRDEPELPVRRYAAELKDGAGLGELAIAGDPDTAIRATFDLSYARLDGPQRRVFRLLSLVPGGDFDSVAVARLAGIPRPRADEQLASLIAAHLVDTLADGRCTMHDMVRAYAAEKAADSETPKQIRTARDRLFSWYLATARAASTLTLPELPLLPGPIKTVWTDPADARRWLEAELPNLVATVKVANRTDLPEYAWRLPDAMRGYLWHAAHRTDWLNTASTALEAATAAGDPLALTAAHLNLGWYHFVFGRDQDAREHYGMAAQLAEPAGWVQARVSALVNIARAERDLGQLASALAHTRTALTLASGHGLGPARKSIIDGLMASICLPAGLLAEALDHAQLAAAGAVDSSPISRAGNAVILGDVHLARGETDLAAQRFAEAREIFEGLGHRAGQAKSRTGLGAVAIERELYPQAAQHLDEAVSLARQAGDEATDAEACLHFGRLMLRTGKAAAALDHLNRVRQLRTSPTVQISALIERSRALTPLGRHADAAQAAREAMDEAGRSEYAPLVAAAEQALRSCSMSREPAG